MVRPGNDGSTPPAIDQLEPLFTELVDLLGELAGNEQFLATLEAADPSYLTPSGPSLSYEQSQHEYDKFFMVAHGRHQFAIKHRYIAAGDTPDEQEKSRRELQQRANQAWNDAHADFASFYGGVPTLRSTTQQIWEPDPNAMAESAQQLTTLARWFLEQTEPEAGWDDPTPSHRADEGGLPAVPQAQPPGWLLRLRDEWPATASASTHFYEFWDDVDDKSAHYLAIAVRLASTCAQVGAAVSATQKNLVEITQKARDHADLALRQWQTFMGPSGLWPSGKFDHNDGVKSILNDVSLASGVSSLYGPQAVVTGPISVITGFFSTFLPARTEIMVATSAATSYEIWTGFIQDLSTLGLQLWGGLDKIHTERQEGDAYYGSIGFEAFLREVQGNRDNWEPPSVNL